MCAELRFRGGSALHHQRGALSSLDVQSGESHERQQALAAARL